MFKVIKDFPNYQINECGLIKSVHVKKMLKHQVSRRGYFSVIISGENGPKHKYIHRLVAETFIPNPGNLPQVDHINGDKSDNTIENLRWASNLENMRGFGYENRLSLSRDSVGLRLIAKSDTNSYSFNTKADLLKHFGYSKPTSNIMMNHLYSYGKLKGYTVTFQ